MDKETKSSYLRKHIISADVKSTILKDEKSGNKQVIKRVIDKRNFQADKQNMIAIENIQSEILQNKSPRLKKDDLKQLKICSPDRPAYTPSGFRSNKANQCIIDLDEEISKANETMVIFSGISKDSKYQIVSRAFVGKQLENARMYQHKINSKIRQKKQIDCLLDKDLPIMQESKTSIKQNGLIKSYAVNTHQGISRNYNEDRVSIILNINKNGVKSTFFAVYDGHGGTGCCDFLRNYLHQYIINNQHFPQDPKKSIVEGIHKAEAKFTQLVKKKFMKSNQLDRSGSCSIIVMIVGDECFVVNIGDSRAFLSKNRGKIISHLSRDHKPSDERQQKRIIEKGGKIYRTQMTRMDKLSIVDKSKLTEQQYIVGPLRVYPGKLSVTRTFGDIEAKDKDFQGIANCVSVEPEISKFVIDKNDDFLFLGCDGIFEKLQSIEVNKLIWKIFNKSKTEDIHAVTGKCVDEVLKQSMRRKSADNLTGILINLRQHYNENDDEKSLLRDLSCRSL